MFEDVTLMISEEAQAESLVAHLDKSHLCIHTYPEESPHNGIAIFRADLELSTCGVISPLKVLNYLLEEFSPDVADIDYRIRGMTRNNHGEMLFVDKKDNNISENFNKNIFDKYEYQNNNLKKQNLFHCKLRQKKIQLEQLLFGCTANDLTSVQQANIKAKLNTAINKLFY